MFSLGHGVENVTCRRYVDVRSCKLVDDETSGFWVNTVVCRDFSSRSVQRQMRIVTRHNTPCRIPDIPVACAVGALDEDEPRTSRKPAVDRLAGAIACVGTDLGYTSEGGEEVGDVGSCSVVIWVPSADRKYRACCWVLHWC